MEDILVFLGFIAFLFLIIGLIKPSLVLRWGHKKTRGRVLLIFGITFFTLTILYGIFVSPENNQNISGESLDQKINTSQSQSQEISNSQKEDIEDIKTQSEETNDSSEEFQAKGIPGIFPADIYINLENRYGLKMNAKQGATGSGIYYGEKTIKKGIKLVCQIYTDESGILVDFVDFIVDASDGIGFVSQSQVNSIAQDYLGYGATVPYDDSKPLEAKNWVVNNIKNIKFGKTLTKTIGSVELELFGSQYIKTLRLKSIQK